MHSTGNKAVLIAVILLAASMFTGCARVSAGYVGVQSTMAGTGRGMNDVTVGPAWVPYNFFTSSIMEYPTFVQTAVWTHTVTEGHPTNEEVTFSTKDSMQVAADISIAYSLVPDKVPAFYLKFRSDDLDTFTHGFLRNLAREKFDNAAGKYSVEQIMGDNAQFLAEVRSALQADLDPIGVKLSQFGFIGSPRPPQTVIEAINAKVEATQLALQKQNEVAQAQADAQKAITAAEGQAKANRTLSESLTPSLVEYMKVQKWDGKLPTVQGTGGVMLSMSK